MNFPQGMSPANLLIQQTLQNASLQQTSLLPKNVFGPSICGLATYKVYGNLARQGITQ